MRNSVPPKRCGGASIFSHESKVSTIIFEAPRTDINFSFVFQNARMMYFLPYELSPLPYIWQSNIILKRSNESYCQYQFTPDDDNKKDFKLAAYFRWFVDDPPLRVGILCAGPSAEHAEVEAGTAAS